MLGGNAFWFKFVDKKPVNINFKYKYVLDYDLIEAGSCVISNRGILN